MKAKRKLTGNELIIRNKESGRGKKLKYWDKI